MGTLSATRVTANKTTIASSDLNTPLTEIEAVVNGGLTTTNFTAAGTDLGTIAASTAWTSYTPTWTSSGTAPSLGNGTATGSYIKIGRTVIVSMKFVFGSTTTFGTGYYYFSLPATANTNAINVGSAFGSDTGTAERTGVVLFQNTTNVKIHGNGLGNPWGQTIPHTWANTDIIQLQFTYESAS